MQRILILGCCGAGKSTLSRSLAEQLNLPIIHLDQHYWQPNWKEPTRVDWEEKVKELIKEDKWIMDGNYSGTIDIRINRADTIIYLESSTIKCLYRVMKRIVKYRGKVRPDMPPGCPERFDLGFLHYVAVFNIIKRKPLLKKIQHIAKEKQVHIIRRVDKYISTFNK